jgi:hypothetical protein
VLEIDGEPPAVGADADGLGDACATRESAAPAVVEQAAEGSDARGQDAE